MVGVENVGKRNPSHPMEPAGSLLPFCKKKKKKTASRIWIYVT